MSIDETCLSRGELYTIITNKSAKGRKGAIVAMIKGTKADTICDIVTKLPRRVRYLCKEITLDFANNMSVIAKKCFPVAVQVNDRFHLHQLVHEAVQEVRIRHRWEAIEAENKAIKDAKEKKIRYEPQTLENGDTLKQLLARSRYLLYKTQEKWTESQALRAKLIFELYPDIKKAYDLSNILNQVFKAKNKEIAYTRLARWYNDVENSKLDTFRAAANTIMNHYETILNYFNKKSTNASAESFNAKIKAFRAMFRGVVDTKFFLYRLAKIYA